VCKSYPSTVPLKREKSVLVKSHKHHRHKPKVKFYTTAYFSRPVSIKIGTLKKIPLGGSVIVSSHRRSSPVSSEDS
jgi:hypothetical protein